MLFHLSVRTNHLAIFFQFHYPVSWSLRQELGIGDAYHIQMVLSMYGDQTLNECTSCSAMAELYVEYGTWYCHSCEEWC